MKTTWVCVVLLLVITARQTDAGHGLEYLDNLVDSAYSPVETTFSIIRGTCSRIVDVAVSPFYFLLNVVDAALKLLRFSAVELVKFVFYTVDLVVRYPVDVIIYLINGTIRLLTRHTGNFLADSLHAAFNSSVQEITTVYVFIEYLIRAPPNLFANLLEWSVASLLKGPVDTFFDVLVHVAVRRGIESVVWIILSALHGVVYILRLPVDAVVYVLNGLVVAPLYIITCTIKAVLWFILGPFVVIAYLLMQFVKFLFVFAILICTLVVILLCCDYAARQRENIVTFTGRLRNLWDVFHGQIDRRRRRIKNESLHTQTAAVITESFDEDTTCVVCFEERPLMKLLPCNHQNICLHCYWKIKTIDNKCPLCRTFIATIDYATLYRVLIEQNA